MKIEKYLINEKRKETIQSVAEYVNSEGLGYAIQSGLSWKNIEDKQLAKYWRTAEDSLNEISNILEEYLEY